MKRSLRYGLIAAAGLLAAAAVLPPLLIDKAAVQHRLERAAYDATGRELAIGSIGFSLLPTPRLHADGLRLANWPDSAEPWMLDVKRMTIAVSAGDLLRGRLVAQAVELDSPRLTLERRAGRGNWSFVPPGQMPPRPGAAAPAAIPAAAPAAAVAPAAPQAEGDLPIAVEKLLVRDGRIVYRDGAADRTVTAAAISLDAMAQSPQGPFRVEGAATVSGHAVAFKGDSGRVQPGRAVPLHVEATAENGRAKLDGLLLRDTDAGPVLKGNLDAAIADVAAFAARFGAPLPGPLAGRAAALSGQLRVDAGSGEVTEGQLRLGPAEATGRIAWHLDGNRPKLTADLTSRHVDIDSFTAPRAAREDGLGGVALLAPAVAHAAQPAPPFAFSLPTGVDADVKLAADAVTWHGDAARAALLDFSLNRGDVVVNQVSAELPGAAQVRAIGFIGGDLKRLDITLQAGAANLRGLLSWLGVDTGAVPADRLRHAGLSARAAMSADGLIQVRDIDAVLDASRAKGALDLLWGRRPAFGLSLAVDRFDLDAYRGAAPGPAAAAKPRILAAAAPAPAAAPEPAAPLWGRFDANLDLQIGRFIAGGQPLDKLRLRGRWQNATLDVAGLSADIGGDGRITASGKIATQGTPRIDALKAEVTTPRADRLLGLLPVSWPGFVRSWRALTATLSADGPLTDLRTDAAVGVGEAKLSIAGRFDGVRMRPSAEGDISISAPTLGALATVLDADVAPELAKKGAVEIYIPLNGDAQGYAVPALTATAGDIAIGGELTVKTDGPRPQVSARLVGNLLPVLVPRDGAPRRAAAAKPRILPATAPAAPPAPLVPGNAEAAAAPPPAWALLREIDGDLAASFDSVVAPKLAAQQVKLTARLNQGLLTLDEAAAKLLGGSLAAKGRADLTAIPKLSATVDAKDIAVDAKSPLFSGAAPLAGTVTLSAEGEAAGGDADTLLRGLNGKGKLAVLKGSFAGADLGAVNDRLARIRNLQDLISAFEAGGRGRTAFDSLTGTFTVAGGVLESRDLKLSAPSGAGSATGTADLAARKVNAEVRFALASLKDAPPLGMRLQGAWENPRVFFDTGDFQGYMIQKGLKNLLRSLSKPKPSADEPPPPKGGLKAKDVLREVLQAIPKQ